MALQDTGRWEELLDWPLIGLHAVVTQDGKVLTFGTDSRGMQGGEFIYDVWDPLTNTHETLTNVTPTDIFCSAAIILPGTNKILIGGGDDRTSGNMNAGVDDVNIFDSGDLSLTQEITGNMNFERWYPTMINLPTGQIVIMGGIDSDKNGIAVPEIFTPGEGWRKLEGATDTDLAKSDAYPRAWVNADGEIIYFASGVGTDGEINVMALDASGDGSLREVGKLPFPAFWGDPAIMYEAGKVLILGTGGQAWTMDINGPIPIFEQVESLSQVRDWADLTVMADGKVLINGGSSTNNTQAGADTTAAIFDPESGTWDYTVDEDNPRLYHSSTVLLADGTILSLGGGAGAGAEQNFLDGQIYKPPYLFNAAGELAERPLITAAPDELVPGETFTIQVDDASAIEKITFSKNGAATHSFNMEARLIELDFTIGANNTIEVTLPENANIVTAGSWMLFAFNAEGVPSIAPIIAVNPTIPAYDGIGDLLAEHYTLDGPVSSLDEIDFDAAPDHTEKAFEINEANTLGTFYEGGPVNYFAVKYSGQFEVSVEGEYTFYATSDDYTRLFIDGELVIDQNGAFTPTLKTGTAALSKGVHNIEFRHFEDISRAMVDLDWSGPGFNRKQMTFDGVQENLLVNGGFEMAGLADGVTFFESIPGWTSSTGRLEINDPGTYGHNPSSGHSFTEINGAMGDVSQSIQTEEGRTYNLTFDYTGRHNQVASSQLVVMWNNEIISTITPTDTTWHTYSFEVSGTGGADRLTFRAVDGDTDTKGGQLDSVVLTAGELVQDPNSTNTINGTNGDDYLNGTNANDLINLLTGNDVVNGSAGNDVIIGDNSSYDQVDYEGKASDYNFTLNSNGSINVTKPDGSTDHFTSIEGVWFKGRKTCGTQAKTLLMQAATRCPVKPLSAREGNDYIHGSNGDDTIIALGGELMS